MIKIRKKLPIIRYAGSLIQQRHDEPLKGHGYSFWDLKTKTYKHIEIPNEYGFFTAVVENGVIISDLTDIPKKTRLRLQLRNTTTSEVKAAIIEIKKLTEVMEISYDRLDKQKSLTRVPSVSGSEVLGDVNDKQYQTFLITNYLKNSLGITDTNVISSVIKINNEVNDYVKKDDFSRNIRWIPIKFEWENMFSYGENNVIDFTKAKDLIGLFASNASGKSTIFSALTFCLFDKCERADEAWQVMNDKKMTFSCKFEFEMNGKRYFIKRDAKTDKKGKVKVDVRFWKIEDNKEIDLNGEQRRNTNEIIREYLGSYDDFVLTSLSVQSGKNNQSIIDIGNSDRKDLFAQFMGLTMFDRLYSEGNDRLKERLILLKSYRNDDYAGKLVVYENLLSQANLVYSSELESLEEIVKQRDLLQQTIVDTTEKLIKLTDDIPYIGISMEELKKFNTQLISDKTSLSGTELKIEELTGQLTIIENEIFDLENKKVSELSIKFRELGNKKRDIESERERLKNDYLELIKIWEKAQHIDYNPDCEFCIKHVGVVAQDAKSASEKMKKIEEQASIIKTELDSVEKEIEYIKWSFDANLKLMSLLSKRNSLKDNKIELSEQITKFKDSIRINEDGVKKHEKNIELYNENKQSIEFNEKIYNQLGIYKTDFNKILYSYKTKNEKLMDINGKISVCKNQISELTNKISQIKVIEKEYQSYDLYCQCVCRDGIPLDIITATLPEIQNEVNSILSQTCEFTTLFEIDGKNIIPYIVYDDRKWLMSLTSGFERFALSLAIRVALINISNLPRSNFLIIDEGFGVLDAENLSLMNTLFSYLKTHFDFIMVVSHLESLRDIVDKHIEITKDNGFSKVNFS